jgi:hypothetical protein
MERERTVLTPRERWVWCVMYVTALLGAVWWYARPWLRSGRLVLVVLALSLVLVGSIWGWMRRTRDEREVERATHLERELWRGTLPTASHDRARRADERIV